MKACSVSGCDGKYLSKGYCCKHYQRMKKFGDPNAVIQIQGDDAARFASYINRQEDADCWPWKGSITSSGYGRFGLGKKTVRAHRYAYEQAHGEISAGLFVCHLCDNPACVNPRHLWLGTPKDNVRDMLDKGRCCAPRGVTHYKSKLNNEAVKVIRHFASTTPAKTLADAYRVSHATIRDVIKQNTWRHV